MLFSLADMLTWRVRTGGQDATLTDMLFDADTRHLTYLSLAVNGPAGGQALAAASLMGRPDGETREMPLDISDAELARAPHWDGDEAQLDSLMLAMPPLVVGPFGATHAPLAMASYAARSAETGEEDPRAEAAIERYERLTRWLGGPVFARDGEVGSLSDLLFDADRNRIDYLVVDNGKFFGHRQRALPLSALAHRAKRAKGGHLVLDLSKADVDTAPAPDEVLSSS
ncbi:PRC-barrel domain-containing protein [Salipiger abyssi]|uniref:PRC-barrel domain-containing protein n=1 Tax=Salipiger abyssi TaxID=1250539 RepID=UPI001A8C8442|nr:PRC-barrel domain-containing protein [Salipiger abyssi]MBN9890488.1 PRC-barrel domain-containing protein [Salipiger abyssi]